MAKASNNTQKLDLKSVLPALDRQDLNYYNGLTVEEKKAYVPFVLMHYMASAGPQSEHAAYAVIATNELVNKSLFSLGKHPELLHMLLCLTGLITKQYRPYLGAKNIRTNATSTTPVVDEFFISLYPGINATELAILKSQHDKNTLRELGEDAGLSKAEIKELVEDAKKMERDC